MTTVKYKISEGSIPSLSGTPLMTLKERIWRSCFEGGNTLKLTRAALYFFLQTHYLGNYQTNSYHRFKFRSVI